MNINETLPYCLLGLIVVSVTWIVIGITFKVIEQIMNSGGGK